MELLKSLFHPKLRRTTLVLWVLSLSLSLSVCPSQLTLSLPLPVSTNPSSSSSFSRWVFWFFHYAGAGAIATWLPTTLIAEGLSPAHANMTTFGLYLMRLPAIVLSLVFIDIVGRRSMLMANVGCVPFPTHTPLHTPFTPCVFLLLACIHFVMHPTVFPRDNCGQLECLK